MPKGDHSRIRHMIDATQEALSFVENRSREDLDTDRMFALALVKAIEIVGEAAAGLEPETRSLNAEIPWTDIVGMRNRLIHGYFEIDMDRVWDTVTDDLPKPLKQLEAVELANDGVLDT